MTRVTRVTPADTFTVLADPAALARAAANRFVEIANESIRSRGRFNVALAGGSTPQAMHKLLAEGLLPATTWAHTFIYFGDERCVPPEDSRSNYASAHKALLSRVPIPAEQVHRMQGELAPAIAADRYQALLTSHFKNGDTFDLIFLGMGADGHTLSLFPGRDFAADKDRLAVTALAPPQSPVQDRITLTLDAVARARHAIFLIAGQDKARTLGTVRAGRPAGRADYPASLITCRTSVEWLVDRAAASPA